MLVMVEGVVGEVARGVYGYAVELRKLAGLGRVSGGQLVRVRCVMGLLRGAGFGSGEISLLSGGRWGASYVRRFALWDGVVDVSRRDAVMDVFAGFVAKGGHIDDVPGYLGAKEALDPVGLTFKNAALIGKAVEVCGMSPRGMVAFSAELVDGGRSIADLSARLKLDEELNGLKLTIGVQKRIRDIALSYPSIGDFLNVIGGYEVLEEVVGLVVSLRRADSRPFRGRSPIWRIGSSN